MKGLLGKFEVIIALVLLAVFIMWSASKCREATVKNSPEETAIADSLARISQPVANTDSPQNGVLSDALRAKIAERAAADSMAAAVAKDSTGGTLKSARPAAPKTEASVYSQLYVTIDKLKIRGEPGLESKVLGELKLFDKVYFLEEVTDTTYEVNLGYELADEPYVKVKTKRGTVGWVYGAGVNYYKKKREGVME